VSAVIEGWNHLRSGKVRDLYTNTNGELLIVASDRISAFDFILPTPIPGKGKLLTQLSLFWFEMFSDLVPNHLISTDVPREVKDRAVIVKPLEMFPIECVARGYLTGSGWVEYQKTQSVTGIELPAGLLDGSKLPENIFTPATKAEMGDHDENICLGDEALTPDSSRFWSADTWKPGGAQPSFDKQYVRDWLLASGWDRKSPPPELPTEVVEKTRERYEAAFTLLTGRNI